MRILPLIIGLVFSSHFLFSQDHWVMIDAGTQFSVALKSDGTLWSTGFNGNGQLGNGTLNQQDEFQLVNSDTDWAFVAAGGVHTVAIKDDGTLWTWGGNGVNQLGNGSTTDETSPIQIGTDTDWSTAHASQGHTLAIKNDGTLWSWGFNTYGQCGDSTTVHVSTPTQIGTDTDWIEAVAGGAHSIALKSNGTIWTWGANFNGQLGTGLANNEETPVMMGADSDWMSIDAGFEFSLALKSDGTLWSWGFNGNGQLGLGNTTEFNTPQLAGGGSNTWNEIEAGSTFAFGIRSTDELYAWGFNGFGQLGNGSTTDQHSPALIGASENLTQIACATGLSGTGGIFGHHTLGLNDLNTSLCVTGKGDFGQLGVSGVANFTDFQCETLDLDESIEEFSVKVYPTITYDFITIEVDQENVSLLIHNTLGESVHRSVPTSNITHINCQTFSKGVYFVEIIGEKSSVTRKFIVQ